MVAERARNGLFCVPEDSSSSGGRPAVGWHAAARPPSFHEAMVIASSTWSTTSVNALLAGLIGIAATLLGSFTTYLFQSRTAERAQHSSATSDSGTNR